MSKSQGFLKLAYCAYNLKPVTITTKEQLPMKDRFYIEGETLRVPFWYAKLLYIRNAIEPIKELLTFETKFSQAIGNQNLNKASQFKRGQLIKVDQDFYFEFFDYLKHVVKRESQKKEKSKRLKEFKTQRTFIIMNLLRMENPDPKQISNMTFEEIIFYDGARKARDTPFKMIFDRAVNTGDNDVVDEQEDVIT